MATRRHVKHYLLKWYNFDTNFKTLNEAERTQMKVLYASLKHLTPEEQEFLAAKYRVEKNPYVKTDKKAADQQGMTYQQYRYKRTKIEDKLRFPVGKYSKKYQDELSRAVTLIHGK